MLTQDEAYAVLGKIYATNLSKSMHAVWKEAILKGWIDVSTWGPEPLVVVEDDKILLHCQATPIRQSHRGPVQGFHIRCYGTIPDNRVRILREEHVPPTTSKKDQQRIMDAMCDIIALQ